MKLLKIIPLLLVFTFVNLSAHAEKNCDEIKGNIVGKLFCKATANGALGSSGSETSNSTEESGGWKLWKKPEWMKKKN